MGGLFLQLLRTARLLKRVLAEPEGRVLAGLVAVQLTAGTIFYNLVEGWGWIDSLYFSVVTLATVGFGDFTPTTDVGKIFTVLFILNGVGILVAFLNFMAERAGRRRSGQEHSG
ncbi:MAG: potassium channel family protein [Jiangellaceae bacterium]